MTHSSAHIPVLRSHILGRLGNIVFPYFLEEKNRCEHIIVTDTQ